MLLVLLFVVGAVVRVLEFGDALPNHLLFSVEDSMLLLELGFRKHNLCCSCRGCRIRGSAGFVEQRLQAGDGPLALRDGVRQSFAKLRLSLLSGMGELLFDLPLRVLDRLG